MFETITNFLVNPVVDALPYLNGFGLLGIITITTNVLVIYYNIKHSKRVSARDQDILETVLKLSDEERRMKYVELQQRFVHDGPQTLQLTEKILLFFVHHVIFETPLSSFSVLKSPVYPDLESSEKSTAL